MAGVEDLQKNTHQKLREIIESFPRQALHAAQLSFIDPTTSKEVSFQSKITVLI